MSEQQEGDTEQEWKRAAPRAGLSTRQVWAWMMGKQELRDWPLERGPDEIMMEASPYGWSRAGPPYHTMPVPSPMLVPRVLRPIWALAYYLPLILLRRWRNRD